MTFRTKWLSPKGTEWFDDREFETVEDADRYADIQIEAMLNDGEEPPEYLGAYAK